MYGWYSNDYTTRKILVRIPLWVVHIWNTINNNIGGDIMNKNYSGNVIKHEEFDDSDLVTSEVIRRKQAREKLDERFWEE